MWQSATLTKQQSILYMMVNNKWRTETLSTTSAHTQVWEPGDTISASPDPLIMPLNETAINPRIFEKRHSKSSITIYSIAARNTVSTGSFRETRHRCPFKNLPFSHNGKDELASYRTSHSHPRKKHWHGIVFNLSQWETIECVLGALR